MLVARRQSRLEDLAAEVGKAHAIAADLSACEAPRRIVDEVEKRGLVVSTLINNAGFGLIGRFADLPLDRQRQMLDLNVAALTELTHLVLPAMKERRTGGILNLASTAAFQPGPGFAVYFASKAFVLCFTEALHQELEGTGIKVSALCPGPTSTEFGAVAGFRDNRFERVSMSAPSVVAAGLRGLDRNRAVVVPGLTNKIGAQSSRFLPRAAMRRIMASLKLSQSGLK